MAGGWVRDKLLDKESNDIDIAVSGMSGQEFASWVNKYLSQVRKEEAHAIGVIRINPAQSKHLETATFKIDGVSIDVNNLRKETYGLDSRIPNTVVLLIDARPTVFPSLFCRW